MISQTRWIMGMPVTVSIVDHGADKEDLQEIFEYFKYVDKKFSTYKKGSEISQINSGKLVKKDYSLDMKRVIRLSESTKKDTNGFFDIFHNGKYDPSGLVKGWAIYNASMILKKKGFRNFYLEAGGDIEAVGKNEKGRSWGIGIRNPFNYSEIVKVLKLSNKGVATSGSYLRGDHIYNPMDKQIIEDIVSLTVIGPSVYEADRYATAAFAMGKSGIGFIERQPQLEGYMIDCTGIATMTSGFEKYQ